ncbi:hypothetical protein IP92_01083 [Pseudoduganella flava]|uniref:SGNH/GDSL hydrolase family protein n=1 Tax=Pseudoduganella flava TaxID=871742 RepID=A0A562Q090_9BURK|nr:hypothetical protein [Pseudoduganella flava]QGZ38576.1 hypothetical protein GO485_05575 [Pseudoduganella flava]TWI49860.1 hypothetical protein IP92_01083 [Pseudoduganella flava]
MPHIYKPEEHWNTDGGYPSALAIGDSWFWYINNSMLGTLVNHPHLSDDHRNVQLVGYNGARLADYVGGGRFADIVAHFLQPAYAESFSEFYISGAGNDAVDVGLALRPDCSAAGTAADCVDDASMDELLGRLSATLRELIAAIRAGTPNGVLPRPIFIHGYDYPVPDGRGFGFGLIHSGPWLAPALDAHRVPPDMALRAAIAQLLIDRLNEDVFAPLHDPHAHVIHIDSRGILTRTGGYTDDWANEMHPTNRGFARIFEAAWLPALRGYGIAH